METTNEASSNLSSFPMNEAALISMDINKVRSSLSHGPLLKLSRSSSEGSLYLVSSSSEEHFSHYGYGEALPSIANEAVATAQQGSGDESMPHVQTLNSATIEVDSLLNTQSAAADTTDLGTGIIDVNPKVVSSATPESSIEQERMEERLLEQISLPADNTLSSSQVQHPDCTKDVTASQFVPSLGSWAKPLIFKPPVTPPEPSTPKDYDPVIVGNQLAALWPSLNDEIVNRQPKSKSPTRSLQLPVEKLPPPELKADGTLRFPWAARLSPQSRNLYRAATPTYRLDGTPEVTIPSKVLRLGPQNKDEYIIGKFHRCSLPPGGLIHAVVNRIWGRSCKISCKKLGDSSYMFHIPHEATRQWVIQRGVWHIDDCLLFVLPWTPEGSFKIPEISTLPVWVTLKNIPDCCYSRLGISHVASGLGEPILTHKPRLDPTNMGEAKVLVEMELDKDFPKLIALDDKQGSIYLVKVDYTWIPSTCERCGSLGHKAKRCLLSSKPPDNSSLSTNPVGVSTDIPVVDIDLILQQTENVGSPSSTVQLTDVTTSGSEQKKNTQDVPCLHSDLVADPQLLYGSSHDSMKCQDTQVTRNTTISSTSQVQGDNQTTLPTLAKTLSPLVDLQSAPISASIMESSPSNIINNEVTSNVDSLTTLSHASAYESPSRYAVLDDADETENESLRSMGLTRGRRETKPPLKYQDLEWKTVQGRGKHGHRGRGSTR